MIRKKLLYLVILALAVVSCSKDDSPSAPDKPTITTFTPSTGPVGTPFVITGTNFSTTTSKNSVKIGTATATVSSATATKITTSVPVGATTGKVSVTVGGETATGGTFTVTEPVPNNTAPVINNENPVFSVTETLAIDVPVGTIDATDADQDVLNYVLSGTNSGHFMISAAGVIGLAEGEFLDFETTPVYNLTVSVSDGNGGVATTDITINVTDVDEAPEVESLNLEFPAAEDIADTDIIGTVVATDPEGADIDFSIKKDESLLFEINDAGQLSLLKNKALDFETETEHELTVDVSDGKNTVTVTITITVTDVEELLADDPASFVTTWTTENDMEEIAIGVDGFAGTYDFQIDWGDGSTVENWDANNISLNSSIITHTYDTAETYTVAIKGAFPAIKMSVTDATPNKLTTIEQWGGANQVWKSMNRAFINCSNVVINALDTPNVTEVTNMSYMFAYTYNLFYSANSTDFSNWDTSNVTNMSYAFQNSSFNSPIEWNTSSVTNMASMFQGAGAFNKAVNNWDVSNVTNMSSMFEGAIAFNRSLGDWILSNIQNMENMLDNTALSVDNYDATLEGWNNNLLPQDITLGAIGLAYCSSKATRDDGFVNARNWMIVGDVYEPLACLP